MLPIVVSMALGAFGAPRDSQTDYDGDNTDYSCPPDCDQCDSVARGDCNINVNISCKNKNDHSNDLGCFAPHSTTLTNDPAAPTKSMQDLPVGDHVLATNARNELVYSPVIAFLDKQAS